MPTSLTPTGIVASLCVAAVFALCASEASAEPAATRTQGEAKPARERQRLESKGIDEHRETLPART